MIANQDAAIQQRLGALLVPVFIAATAVAVLTFFAVTNLAWLFSRRWRFTVLALTLLIVATANWLGFLLFRVGRLLFQRLIGAA